MTEPNDETAAAADEERCPVCRRPMADNPNPRYRLALEDETGQRSEHEVCQTCWEDLRGMLSTTRRSEDDG